MQKHYLFTYLINGIAIKFIINNNKLAIKLSTYL